MQSFFMDQLHEQEFILLLTNFFWMLCEHVFALVQVQQQGIGYQLVLTPFHYVYPPPISLQHFVFISVYHILQLCIFHNVSVVIPLMIWVFVCYIVHVGVNALQPTIPFKISLQLWHWKVQSYTERGFSPFPPPHRDEWILSSPETIFEPQKMLSLWTRI